MAVSRRDLNNIVKATIVEIIDDVVLQNPRFKGKEDYLMNYLLDKKAIYGAADNAIQNLTPQQKRRMYPDQVTVGVVHSLNQNPRQYLTERGKESILREYAGFTSPPQAQPRGLIGRLRGFGARRFQGHARGVDGTVNAAAGKFVELKYLAEKYDGAITPETETLLTDMYRLGWAYESIDVLQHYKELKPHEANKWRAAVRSGLKKGGKEFEKTLYEIVQKYTKLITFLLGTSLLAFSSSNITGFAVAGRDISPSYTIGAGFILLLIALFLALLPRRKREKNQEKAKRNNTTKFYKASRREYLG